MRSVQLLIVAMLVTGLSGCSMFKSRGSGDSGNIPYAQAGSELGDVNFAFDSAELNSGAQSVLRANAEWIKANSGAKVNVEGHCDERGTPEYNLALGERRAHSVHSYLQSLGVSGSQMGMVSYGEELPLDPGHTEDAWSKNRRAHFGIQR